MSGPSTSLLAFGTCFISFQCVPPAEDRLCHPSPAIIKGLLGQLLP